VIDGWAGGSQVGFSVIGDWRSCMRVFVGWGGLRLLIELSCVGRKNWCKKIFGEYRVAP